MFGSFLPEQDERHHLQDVRDDRREHGHVEQRRHDLRAQFLLLEGPDQEEHGVPDDRSRDQRRAGSSARRVCERNFGKYPARESEYVFLRRRR